MDTHELLKKITALPVIANILAGELLAGNFSSVFKGQGMEFDEVRHYQLGDDIRSIDWNASARFGYPFVKMYREERDLTIMLLLDISASMHREGQLQAAELNSGNGSGFVNQGLVSPFEQGLLAAALLAFSAERTGQRVGMLLFDRTIERIFPPRKGRRHIMAFIGAALKYQHGMQNMQNIDAQARGSNIELALSEADRLLRRRSLVVAVSDFVSVNWETKLKSLCSRHDVLSLRINHLPDINVPEWGLAAMEDPETNIRITVPTGFTSFREAWSLWHRQRAEVWENSCRSSGAAYLDMSTADDAASVLLKFFGASAAGHMFHKRTGAGGSRIDAGGSRSGAGGSRMVADDSRCGAGGSHMVADDSRSETGSNSTGMHQTVSHNEEAAL